MKERKYIGAGVFSRLREREKIVAK